jgi:hypothetical protein
VTVVREDGFAGAGLWQSGLNNVGRELRLVPGGDAGPFGSGDGSAGAGPWQSDLNDVGAEPASFRAGMLGGSAAEMDLRGPAPGGVT